MAKKNRWITGGLILFSGLCIAGCGRKDKAPVEKDYASMTWDQIAVEAKAEGSLVFYSWWGEEHWIDAGK